MIKKKLLFIVLIFSVCCAIQNVKTDASMYEGFDFDTVWKASMLAINDVGFTIMNVDKDSGIIITTKEENWATQKNPPQMNIIIQENKGAVNVYCKYVERGQIMNLFGTPQKDMKKFISALNTRLED